LTIPSRVGKVRGVSKSEFEELELRALAALLLGDEVPTPWRSAYKSLPCPTGRTNFEGPSIIDFNRDGTPREIRIVRGNMKFSVLAKWFCAVAETWNAGEAPWAYVDGRSESVRIWNERGDEGLVEWAQSMGVSLRRRKR
jgi:hypothetical protein